MYAHVAHRKNAPIPYPQHQKRMPRSICGAFRGSDAPPSPTTPQFNDVVKRKPGKLEPPTWAAGTKRAKDASCSPTDPYATSKLASVPIATHAKNANTPRCRAQGLLPSCPSPKFTGKDQAQQGNHEHRRHPAGRARQPSRRQQPKPQAHGVGQFKEQQDPFHVTPSAKLRLAGRPPTLTTSFPRRPLFPTSSPRP